MIKSGIFKIETSFNITGRGIVVVGQLLEGRLLIGSYISVNITGEDEMVKIIGVEWGKPDENDIVKWGALLKIEDPVRIKFIGENKIKEQVSILFKE
jgi:hypothetical protein